MLTGEKPYIAETPLAVIYLHVNAPIPRLPPGLSHLQGLLDGLLAKKVDDRFASATAIVGSVDAALNSAAA